MTAGTFPPSGVGTRKGGGSGIAGAGFAGGSGVPVPAAAGITFVGAGANVVRLGASNGSLSPAYHGGYTAIAGDLALAVVHGILSNVPPSFLTPSGWTRPNANPEYDGSSGVFVWPFWKVLTAGEALPNFVQGATNDLGGGWGVYVMIFRGVHQTTPFDVATTGNGSALGTAGTRQGPSITPTTANAMVLSIVDAWSLNGTALQTANGFSVAADGASYATATGNDFAAGAAYKLVAVAAPTTGPTWQVAGGGAVEWASLAIALRPA